MPETTRTQQSKSKANRLDGHLLMCPEAWRTQRLPRALDGSQDQTTMEGLAHQGHHLPPAARKSAESREGSTQHRPVPGASSTSRSPPVLFVMPSRIVLSDTLVRLSRPVIAVLRFDRKR